MDGKYQKDVEKGKFLNLMKNNKNLGDFERNLKSQSLGFWQDFE